MSTADDGFNRVLSVAVEKGLVSDSQPSVDLFDLDYFRARLRSAKAAFPEPFILHAMALKANSIRGVVQTAKEEGFGGEGASIAEAFHALSMGIRPEDVVFDSPCKTKVDLKMALKAGVYINIDNEQEAAVLDELLRTDSDRKGTASKIGLRVNPVVGGGSIALFNVGTAASKFGLPITDDTRDRVLDLYKKYSWLTGVHIHVGSQGLPLELFVKAARICMDFVAEVERVTGRQMETVDIGGGLSTSYTEPGEPEQFSYAEYRARLDEAVPELFSGKYRIITEFGRSLTLKAGKTVSRVEYIKQWVSGVKPIILTHVGSNNFVREVYRPDVYTHRVTLAGSNGEDKTGADRVTYDIAGPLCFQGDYLRKDVELPEASNGDLLVIHETGGYCMALYSKFNSILPSPVYGYQKNGDGGVEFICFKERETCEDTLKFWGLKEPRVV